MDKNKGGRPKKTIDFEQFENLMSMGCTEAEVCSVLKVTDKTLNNLLKQEYDKGFSELHKEETFFGKTKASLRRAQIKSALGGNTSMLIWLGKQFIGQTEKQEIDQNIHEFRVELTGEDDE